MKAKAFRNLGVMAMAFASFVTPVLNAQLLEDEVARNSNNEEVLLEVLQNPVEVSRALWNQQGRYLHDAVVAITNQGTGLTGAAYAAQLTALNNGLAQVSIAIGNLLIHNSPNGLVGNNDSSSSDLGVLDNAGNRITANDVANLLNLYIIAAEQTFVSAQAGDAAGVATNYANWQALGTQIAVALHSANRFIDLNTIQTRINQYIVLEIQQFQFYQAGNYAAGLVASDQAIALLDAIGVYLAQATILEGRFEGVNPFANVVDHDENFVPHFGLVE